MNHLRKAVRDYLTMRRGLGFKLVQPSNRGTLPAILSSLLRLLERDEHAAARILPVGSLFRQLSGFLNSFLYRR